MDIELTEAQIAQRTQANLRHGARSPREVRRVARLTKRRFLRQNDLLAADLDGVCLAYLDVWARAQSKVELYDRWAAEHGWLDDDGKEPGFTKTYFAALNSARLSLVNLEKHLPKKRARSIVAAMQEPRP